MEKNSFSSLIEIFSSIEVKEKGVEIVYDYLLKNQSIDNPKELANNLDLSIKRIYKIFSLLKQLGLIQVYDRPMKITINEPISAWEKLLSEKITSIRSEGDLKIDKCEKSFVDMKSAYKITREENSLPPVEYINILDNDDAFEFLKNDIIGNSKELSLTRGIKYDIKTFEKIFEMLKDPKNMKEKGYSNVMLLVKTILKKMPSIKYRILVSKERAQEILQFKKMFSFYSTKFEEFKINFQNIWEIRIYEGSCGDFIILDSNELIQFSIDPSKKLLGIFISRSHEITDIFFKKFEEMYSQALKLEDFFKQIKFDRTPTIFDKFIFSFF
ncbi:hypothetical protein DSAG12_02406 [Promethearchaeum syntrophicum]|uniref:Sugar-specific transcriptional regulator TrmB n=1 Tax=Promethearchaeum syntrophicum TaxID=2594042 RepID=A0A5B9DCY2_9ARCH|nr:hypothetical protein [Candidatus Prometheoarchaeum syntrophicum]QEE16576.1 hypothetical protein DSAG12_02406 [Candidatus Prometheoarchaeum syntrophicum]